MKQICIIIPYFGEKFPPYFDFFLKSVSMNQDIDFLFLTDIESPYLKEIKNIKLIPFSLNQFKELADKKLEIKTKLEIPYKLCDFKPAYGYILNDLIIQYDYWGHCDIDLIFGRISHFIQPLLQEEYDVISARKEYLSGFFTLYKNQNKINTLFKKSRDWEKVFTRTENFCFDECNYDFYRLLIQKRPFAFEQNPIESMTEVIFKDTSIKSHFKTLAHEYLYNTEFCDKLELSKDGLIDENGKEYLLHHFIKMKSFEEYHFAPIVYNLNSIFVDELGVSSSQEVQQLRSKVLLDLPFKVKENIFFEKIGENLFYKSKKYSTCRKLDGWETLYKYFIGEYIIPNDIIKHLSDNLSLANLSGEEIRENIYNLIVNGLLLLRILEICPSKLVEYKMLIDDFVNRTHFFKSKSD